MQNAKNRGILIVAIVALVVSVSALYLDNRHLGTQEARYDELKKQFEDVTKPHVRHERHEEIYDHISLLWDQIVIYRDWVSTLAPAYREEVEPYYKEALGNFQEAVRELRAGNFEEAMQFIGAAYESMTEGAEAYNRSVESFKITTK